MSSDIWHLHLVQQDKLDNKDDILPYASDDKFVSARNVLDLGTGYGHHIFVLAQSFPEKKFTGLDKDAKAIAHAKQHYTLSNLEFIEADIEEGDCLMDLAPYDYIVARLLVQHLGSVRRFAFIVSTLLKAQGGLLVIDVHEPSKQFVPAMPEYSNIFLRYREWQRRRRNDEEVFLLPLALKEYGFRIKDELIFSRNTDSTLNRDELYGVLATNLSVLEEVYGIPGNYEEARNELYNWHHEAASYGSLGDYIVRAVKD